MTAVLTVGEYADKIMALIDEDIARGQVPAGVASFGELHDHVDANEYFADAEVPWGADLPDEDDPNYLIAKVGDEVTARLAARAPAARMLADVAVWVGDRLGQACHDEADDLPAALTWKSSGPVATITLEDGSRLVVTVAVAPA